MPRYAYMKHRSQQSDGSVLHENEIGMITTDRHDTVLMQFPRLNKVFELDRHHTELFDVKKCGDEHSSKICDRCFRLLSTSDNFENNRRKKDNKITKRPSCRDCRGVKDGKAPDKELKKLWEHRKPEEYTLFECPICMKTSIVGMSRIVLEHNHKTGEPRGYVCDSCNTGMGRFDDDIQIIERAKQWILQSKT